MNYSVRFRIAEAWTGSGKFKLTNQDHLTVIMDQPGADGTDRIDGTSR